MDDNDATSIHRALASPARARVLDTLRTAEAPLGVDALAGRVELHVNTLRGHLGVLEDAGLIASEPEPRARPGRPRLMYRATERADDVSGAGYRFLAQVLSSYVAATAPDPAVAGREAGQAWGRHLVDRPPPMQSVDVDVALARVVDLLDEFGFAPQFEEGESGRSTVHLRRCPFLDTAREHQDVVCSVHLGLMRGALAELGADVKATDLLPFVEPDRCVAHFEAGVS